MRLTVARADWGATGSGTRTYLYLCIGFGGSYCLGMYTLLRQYSVKALELSTRQYALASLRIRWGFGGRVHRGNGRSGANSNLDQLFLSLMNLKIKSCKRLFTSINQPLIDIPIRKEKKLLKWTKAIPSPYRRSGFQYAVNGPLYGHNHH